MKNVPEVESQYVESFPNTKSSPSLVTIAELPLLQAISTITFPSMDENLIRKIGIKEAIKPHQYLLLGDIIISYETLQKESLAQRKEFHDHLSHLILHSILHLIGYDHQEEKMAIKMESLEIKILKKLGLPNPYIN